MSTRYQVHVVLYEVTIDDETGDTVESTLLEEEEVNGYKDDYATAEEAYNAFNNISASYNPVRRDI